MYPAANNAMVAVRSDQRTGGLLKVAPPADTAPEPSAAVPTATALAAARHA